VPSPGHRFSAATAIRFGVRVFEKMPRACSWQMIASCISSVGVGNGGMLGSRMAGLAWSQARLFAAASKEETLKLVKELRSQTGAPIGDVRAALKEADFNLDKAFEVLRKKGAAAAAKKATREAFQVRMLRLFGLISCCLCLLCSILCAGLAPCTASLPLNHSLRRQNHLAALQLLVMRDVDTYRTLLLRWHTLKLDCMQGSSPLPAQEMFTGQTPQ
jgi:hypothetical protein